MNLNKAKIGYEIHVVKGESGQAYDTGDVFVIVNVEKKRRVIKSFFNFGFRYGITMIRKNSDDKSNYYISFTNLNNTFKIIIP